MGRTDAGLVGVTVFFNDLTLSSGAEQNLLGFDALRSVWARLATRAKVKAICSTASVYATLQYLHVHRKEVADKYGSCFLNNVQQFLSTLFVRGKLNASKPVFVREGGAGQLKASPVDADVLSRGWLSIGIDLPAGRSVKVDYYDSLVASMPSGQVLLVTHPEHLATDEVARVLYCHEPMVKENADNPGFVSDAHGHKHFKAYSSNLQSSVWQKRTGNGGDAQFKPGVAFQSDKYRMWERRVMLDAVKDGKVTESYMDGHCADLGEVVGACNGHLTHVLRLSIDDRTVHLCPYE